MASFLTFAETKDTGKTKAFDVLSVMGGTALGEVKWYGPWRKYCFFPAEKVLFDAKCLVEVTAFMEAQMTARKK